MTSTGPRVRRSVDVARLVLAAVALAALVLLTVADAGRVAAVQLVPAALTGLPRIVFSVALRRG